MTLSPPKQRLAIVSLLWLWCSALLMYWFYRAGDSLAIGLLWNLFLATIPLLWSSAFQSASQHNSPLLAGFSFGLWLLFLPNAPYILTDLVHLGERPGAPLWYILAILLSCAGAGTLLGYLSLLSIHATIQQRYGKITGWATVVSSLMLCGFGIYIGRFLRWNSWDAFTHPFLLLQSVAGQFINPYPHPHPVSVTLVFGVGLLVGYLGLRAITTPLASNQDALTKS